MMYDLRTVTFDLEISNPSIINRTKYTMLKRKTLLFLLLLVALFLIGFYIYRMLFPAGPVLNEVPNPISDKATFSKNINENIPTTPLKTVYFGDLHVHTKLSLDAYVGGTIATPEEAYLFAKGQAINIFGRIVKIERPLDFAAVTDHAESFGEMYSVQTAGAPGHNTAVARFFRTVPNDTLKGREVFARGRSQGGLSKTHQKFFRGYNTTKSAWQIHLEAAEKHYAPGKFTTLAGYEWTLGRNFAHFHRNILFRDMVVPDYPLSAIELKTPESLWAYLEKITKDGAQVLAIPHNTNLGKGQIFPDEQNGIKVNTKEYLQLQNEYEPLIEIHQAKGNSEVHAAFWKNDEFANFENYDYGFPYASNYARYGLKKGLEIEAQTGINPFQYGIIASTDTHNGTPGNTEETDTYLGNHTRLDLDPNNRLSTQWILTGSTDEWDIKIHEALNPGGLVAVWAEANTRGHIWDALKNKETYGTSGGRIQLRFFGGYDFDNNYDSYEALVKAGYEKGLPMGSILSRPPSTIHRPPSFLIWAKKDVESANLDRVQIIKGWYKEGQVEEKIYTVALSDNRSVNPDGTIPDNGASVNMDTGEWSKDKGAIELQTVWTDPDFDPEARAFYYVRVLELPTARYTLWDKIRYGTNYPKEAVMTIRERAWSSPIWYQP